MSSSNELEDTWTQYIGRKITQGVNLTLDTASATVEYGRENIKTPELPASLTEKMCFDFEGTINGINDRLETSKAAANPTIRGEIEHVKAGRLGEDLVQKELEKLGTVRSGVRIPGTNGRRNEIDLVLQTRSHIYLFEVKYWSGSVELTPDGQWKQIRLKPANPPEIIHENVLEKIRKKEILFRERLQIPKSSVSSFVVFPKSNLELTYAIGREPQVLSSVEFQNWLLSETPSSMKTVAEFILPKNWTGFSEKTSDKIEESLGSCGTWDLVQLEGGRTLQGDFRAGPRGLADIDRKQISSAAFTHSRNGFVGAVRAVFGHETTTSVTLHSRNADVFSTIFARGCVQFELPIDSVVIFREAGKSVDTKVQVNDILTIEFSQK